MLVDTYPFGYFVKVFSFLVKNPIQCSV